MLEGAHQKRVWQLCRDAVVGQGLRWEVPDVLREDDVATANDGGRKHMAVVGVGQFQV